MKVVFKSPQSIDVIKDELKNMDSPKIEFLKLKSILSELLTWIKNIQEEIIPENNEWINQKLWFNNEK